MPVEPGGVWGNSDAELAVKQEAPHFNEGRSHVGFLPIFCPISAASVKLRVTVATDTIVLPLI